MAILNIEDFYKLRFLADLQIYEQKIAFVVAVPRKKTNDYMSTIWLYDKKLKQFTAGPKDSMPRWSPDGEKLCFVSKRGKDKKTQLYVIDSTGGEARLVYETTETITAPQWSNDGKYIYFLKTITEKQNKKDDVMYIDRYPFYFNDKAFVYNKHVHLYRTTLGGKCVQITKGNFNVNSYDLSPTEDKIALTLQKDEWSIYKNELYACTLKGENLHTLTGMTASYSMPKFSPDGRMLGFAFSLQNRGLFQHHKVSIIPATGGTPEQICNLDRDVGNSLNSDVRFGGMLNIAWSDDSQFIYFVVTDHGRTVLYKVNVHTMHYMPVLDKMQSIEAFKVFKTTITYLAQTATAPIELYIDNGKSSKKITNFNRYFTSKKLPMPEHFSFKASDGTNIDGWTLAYTRKNNSPAILEIHGGPKTAYGHAFMFEMHYLASLGYTIIFTNPRGSDGYDEAFALSIKGHFGERDYQDLMEALDYVLNTKSYINSARLGVTGGSYGGFMTNWIVGHTDRFKAAVTQRSISNQISFFGTSDIGPWFNSDQIGKTPLDNLEQYWNTSPIKYVSNIHTPLLIIHAQEDYRCSVEQAYQLYTMLKYFGKETKMVLFPNETHNLSRSGKPHHRIKRLQAMAEWFSKI